MDGMRDSQDVQSSRSIVSHQISTHLSTALASITTISWQVESSDFDVTRLPAHLDNVKACLALAIRALNSEGRQVDQIGPLEPRNEPVQRCVTDTVSMVEVLLHGIDRDVSVGYSNYPGTCLFNYDALQEALLAILLNGAKYSLPGRAVEIRFDSNDSGRLEIRNLGIGVLPAESETIFYEGKQGSNVDESMALEFERVPHPHGHRGLGLFVAREMMRLSGGDVRVLQLGRKIESQDEARDEDFTIFEIILQLDSISERVT